MPLADVVPHRPELMREIGVTLGKIDRGLAGLELPGLGDGLEWNMKNAEDVVVRYRELVDGSEDGRLIDSCLAGFRGHTKPRLGDLRRSIVYHDANDHNILVDDRPGRLALSGLIDFGDACASYTIAEPAVACAYAMLGKRDPLAAACALLGGYHEAYAVPEDEIDVLFDLVRMRLCASVVMSARGRAANADNDYLQVSVGLVSKLLGQLDRVPREYVCARFREACGYERCANTAEPQESLAERRAKSLGPSLSLSYARPLTIVEGRGQWLYDDCGRRYLDAVNNVAHVGHCHPRVVAAGQRQMAVLNTNTRYLHENVVRYAERLAATMPEPLEVCFFVCSGSEANELALRLARAHTQRRDWLVVDGAYHGNTQQLVELSPYKYKGRGGFAREGNVHEVAMPDVYRGRYRVEAADRYAADVADVLARVERGIAAFIAEPLLGCGGQIVPPRGWLAAAFAHVRAAGGLCIADEVQVGFGRVGTHMWAFEADGAVPDIVTLGKPIGNGHPLAAVVTTRAIAESFANGMEYFNTFGGNPVSCAIGLAVLDVLEDEGLMENARTTGEALLAGLRELQGRHELIGDVRGRGLFAGVELVTDRDARTPAPVHARHAVERMKDRGVLISADGPDANVLKIKPPMCFSEHDAARLCTELDAVLGESALR